MSTISELLIKIGADSSGLRKELDASKQQINATFGDVQPLREMQDALTGTTGKVEALIGSFTKIAAIAAGGFGLTSLISGAVEAGENLYQLKNRMGVTTAEAAEFSRIMALTGGDSNTAATAIMRMDKTLSAGGKTAEQTQSVFDALGISIRDQKGQLLPLNKQLEQLAEGYQKAQAAGYGQEFLMQTLGTRGLALTKTLQNYAEAKENAARLESTGLIDPDEMHKMDQEMKLIQMQLGQLKVVGGAALAPIAQEFLPEILSGLRYTAAFIAKNKAEIKDTTKTVVELLAVYKALQAARSIGAKTGSALKSVIGSTLGRTDEVGEVEKTQAKLTKIQERSIKKRLSAMETAANAERREYEKTVRKMEISEAEKTRLVSEFSARRTIALEEAQLKERAAMEKTYLDYQQKKLREAEIATEAEQAKATAATRASARIIEANTAAASSAGEIVVGNTRAAESEVVKADAAAVASGRIVGANTAAAASIVETEAAQEAQTAAEIISGDAAVVQGERKVGAETAKKAAIAETTIAQEGMTAAEAAAGVQATRTTGLIAAGCAGAVAKVKALTASVYQLVGGWMAVAAAMAYVGIKMAEGMKKREAETYTIDGIDYHYNPESGRLTHYEDTDISSERESVNDMTRYYGDMLGGERREVEDDPSDPEFQAAWNERHQNDPDYLAKLQAEQEKNDMESRTKALMESMGSLNIGGGAVGGGGTAGVSSAGEAKAAAPPPVNYEVQHPIGDLAASIAQSRFAEGEQWMGNITDNPRIQCDSFTANIYSQAGISSIGGYDTASQAINDSAFRQAGAYHEAGDGYTPQAGDLVDSAHHVGIYMGNGMVRSRDSSGGVTTWNINDWDSQFGITGYGSISEATGGRITTERMSGSNAEAEAARKAQEAAKKLSDAYKSAHALYTGMVDAVNQNNGYAYQNNVAKLTKDVLTRQQQINQIAAVPGMDPKTIKKLEDELNRFKNSSVKELVRKWSDAMTEMTDTSKMAIASVHHDYEAQAEEEYRTSIHRLEKERREKEKALMRDANDWETRRTIMNWYYAQLEAAEDNLRKAKQAAAGKYIDYLIEEGNLARIVANLANPTNAAAMQKSMDIAGEKKLAKLYVDVWKDAHGSMTEYIADVSSSLYGTMADSMSEFIRGVRSAKSVLQDFGNSVLSMMAKIAAQRLAASWMTGLLGAFSSTRKSGFTLGTGEKLDPSFGYTGSVVTGFTKFAKGGIVTAPTLAMIGEAGENEAVIPLNHENLSAMGGRSKSGGVVVNITNKTDSKVSVQSSSYDEGLEKWVLDVVVDGASRNRGGFGTNLRTALGGQA